MQKAAFFYGILFALFLSIGCAREPRAPIDQVNFEFLLARMTNLHTFAQQPLGDSFLVSSTDPTGGNQDWAVWTKTEPNGRITLLDVQGPGYLSRLWIASADVKNWHIFIDDDKEARILLPKYEIFGGSFPFMDPLAGESSGGRYSLVPIPFSKRIRVEVEPDTLLPQNRNYFQINYTLLDLPHEAVESFPRTFSDKQRQLVNAVNLAHKNIRHEKEALISQTMQEATTSTLAPNGSSPIWEDSGTGLLESFMVRMEAPDAASVMSMDLLRLLRLQMFWDGNRQPSVDVPLGDFFFNALYTRSFASMPIGFVNDTFVCRFPMPYIRGARVQLVNTSPHPVTVSTAARGDRTDNHGLTRRFHAVWRATTTSGELFRLMEARGPGHYIGLYLTAIGQDGSWNILEGDEVLHPDPGRLPPQEGTGLEDYFGGAYYYTSLFDLPFNGLIEKGAMRTDQYRLHMLEAVDFRKSFASTIEFGHANLSQGYMSGTSYWYAEDAQAVPFNQTLTQLLARPNDRFELYGLMSKFFLLERAGLYKDAADRADFFAQRFRTQPWSDVLKVRALGYRERGLEFDAVKPEYERMTKSPFPPAARAARDRLWLEEDEKNALLGIHALAKYRLLINGTEAASGEAQGDLRVARISLADGEYTWTAELAPTHQGSFFSICLRTRHGDITSAGEWESVALTPFPGQTPPDVFNGGAVLPNMTVWAFEPNAWVNMQSPAVGIQLWSFWAQHPVVRNVTLQRRWSLASAIHTPVPTEGEERSPEALRMHAVD
jgi:hypothetical protein